MQFELRKVLKPIALRDYDEAYSEEGLTVLVWVNPPRAVFKERDEIDRTFTQKAFEAGVKESQRLEQLKTAKGDALDALLKENEAALEAYQQFLKQHSDTSWRWFSILWSQGADPAQHWSTDEIRELSEKEPALAEWLFDRTRRMLEAHRSAEKKG